MNEFKQLVVSFTRPKFENGTERHVVYWRYLLALRRVLDGSSTTSKNNMVGRKIKVGRGTETQKGRI